MSEDPVDPRRTLAPQLALYVLVGGASSVVDLGGFALIRSLGLSVLLASPTSFLAGTAFNYVASTTIAFRDGRHPPAQELARLLVVALVGLVLNSLCVWLLVSSLSVGPLFAKAIAIPCVFGWNFLARRWLVFRPELPDGATKALARWTGRT